MRRLSGADSLFVFNETPTCHQHTLKIAVVDPAGADMRVDYDALREQISEALPLLEPFRWRLVRVPLDLGHPYWVDAPDLDLDYHVKRVALPSPGGRRDLARAISRIASVGLDRKRPLWQLWFVEGLADGQVAYITKVHHSLADGVASERLLSAAFADRRDHTPMGPIEPLHTEPVPGWFRLFWLGLVDALRMLMGLPRLLLRTAGVARRARAHARSHSDVGVGPFKGPHTRFDEPLTPHRSLAYETFDLAAIKRVSHAFEASVNDVMLAMTAGALRGYLDQHGELPTAPLTAAVPVSIRRLDEMPEWGNRVASWYVTLATDIHDPEARLREIVRSTRAASAELQATDPELQHAWAEYWRMFRLVTYGVPKLVRPFIGRPSYNAIVSSVPGPATTLYRHGARLVHMISMGPLVEGIGVNFTGWSYAGEMTV
ncbi:MAG TPA: wax ester/triacylglycerol synthase family O-acyltransferase, partial [Kofleriaceae bacterium]